MTRAPKIWSPVPPIFLKSNPFCQIVCLSSLPIRDGDICMPPYGENGHRQIRCPVFPRFPSFPDLFFRRRPSLPHSRKKTTFKTPPPLRPLYPSLFPKPSSRVLPHMRRREATARPTTASELLLLTKKASPPPGRNHPSSCHLVVGNVPAAGLVGLHAAWCAGDSQTSILRVVLLSLLLQSPAFAVPLPPPPAPPPLDDGRVWCLVCMLPFRIPLPLRSSLRSGLSSFHARRVVW